MSETIVNQPAPLDVVMNEFHKQDAVDKVQRCNERIDAVRTHIMECFMRGEYQDAKLRLVILRMEVELMMLAVQSLQDLAVIKSTTPCPPNP